MEPVSRFGTVSRCDSARGWLGAVILFRHEAMVPRSATACRGALPYESQLETPQLSGSGRTDRATYRVTLWQACNTEGVS